jgi:hypothetical protein
MELKMNQKSRNLLTLFTFFIPLLFLTLAWWSLKSKTKAEQDIFEQQQLTVVRSWIHTRSIPLDNPLVLEHGLRQIPAHGDELINDDQKLKLFDSIKSGLNAFSFGGESNYLTFRFPSGVPWVWKPHATISLSNYFQIGTIWGRGTPTLTKQWIKKYGHPDRMVHFLPWAEAIRSDFGESPQGIAEFKQAYIKDYGPGVNFKPPTDPLSQWKLICADMSGDTWYQGLWIGLFPLTSRISVSNYTELPPAYTKIPLEAPFSAQSYGVESGFSNLGIASLGMQSLIEWDKSLEKIIETERSAKIAHVLLTILQREPFPPTRYLFRFVYRNDHAKWVPYDLVDCSLPSGPTTLDVWW